MTNEPERPLERIGSGKRLRFEARLIVAIVLFVLVVGSAYVFIFGSPNASRAYLDSPNANIPHVKPMTLGAHP